MQGILTRPSLNPESASTHQTLVVISWGESPVEPHGGEAQVSPRVAGTELAHTHTRVRARRGPHLVVVAVVDPSCQRCDVHGRQISASPDMWGLQVYVAR